MNAPFDDIMKQLLGRRPRIADYVGNPEEEELGQIEQISIQSAKGPFMRLPGYVTTYPKIVVRALGELLLEYNRAFRPLVASNQQWDEDYRLACWGGRDHAPVNFAVQIDMIGLPKSFLEAAPELPFEVVREILRYAIFEIENSIAMYQLLERIFSKDGRNSAFAKGWRKLLDGLRRKHGGKKIVLLAVTDDKYNAMLQEEFGVEPGEQIPDEEVMRLSGFDAFWGPQQFRDHLEQHNGCCQVQLFVRSSDPMIKLTNPEAEVDHPLLSDSRILREIRRCAITFNIDDPGDDNRPPQRAAARINDTKHYMSPMGMAFHASAMDDVLTAEAVQHFNKGCSADQFTGTWFTPRFIAFLRQAGVPEDQITTGAVRLRGKPAGQTYGCYGHARGAITDSGRHCMRRDLSAGLKTRPGGYVIQPELVPQQVTNSTTGVNYTYIDRVFMGIRPGDGAPVFLCGFRTLLPTQSDEVKAGRLHGNGDTVWAEIRAN